MQAILVVLLLIALFVCIALMLFTSRCQDRGKAVYFAIMLTAVCTYVLGYLLEVLSTTQPAAINALRLENAGIPLVAPFFLLSVMSLFQPDTMRRWMLPIALGYGAVLFLCVLFNEWHHLYYASIDMIASGGHGAYLRLGYGPLHAVQQAVSVGCILGAHVVLLRRYFGSAGIIRNQMRMMIIASLFALAANIANVSGVLPKGLNPTPLALTIAGVFFSIDIHRYKMLDLVALASSKAVETMEDGLVVLDSEQGFQYANLAARQLFPGLANIMGAESVLKSDDWPKELRDHLAPGEVTFCREDAQGSERYYRARISRILSDRSDVGWSYVMRDITDTTAMMTQLEELATTDSLTGIYNRRQFLSMVNHEMEVAARLWLEMTLIMYDLDFFKEVNDTYGHIAGDYVLCAVAGVVKSQLRPYDIFARYGGEEFVIFTTSNEPFDLWQFADRLRMAVERSEIMFEGNHIHITASFGAVRIKPKAKFADAMRAVDVAMYGAKTKGRNQVVVTDIDGADGMDDGMQASNHA